MTKILESYLIDEKVYVTTKFLMETYKVSDRTIRNWRKEGLSSIKERGIPGNLHLMSEVIKWRSENINSSKSRAGSKTKNVILPPPNSSEIEEAINDIQGKILQANEMLQIKSTTQDDADRIKKILDGLVAAVKLGKESGEFIPKKDIEKTIVDILGVILAGYYKDLNVLPNELENRNKEEIKQKLESNYKGNMKLVQQLAKSDLLTNAKLSDILVKVVELLEFITGDEIMEKLNT